MENTAPVIGLSMKMEIENRKDIEIIDRCLCARQALMSELRLYAGWLKRVLLDGGGADCDAVRGCARMHVVGSGTALLRRVFDMPCPYWGKCVRRKTTMWRWVLV